MLARTLGTPQLIARGFAIVAQTALHTEHRLIGRYMEGGNTLLGLSDVERVAPGIRDLSDRELEAVHHFTLLWTLFEAQVLGSNGSSRKMAEIIREMDDQVLAQIAFREQLRYFHNRYIENGEANFRFENLNRPGYRGGSYL